MKIILALVLVCIWVLAYYKYTKEVTAGIKSTYGLVFHLTVAFAAGWGVSDIIMKLVDSL